MLSHPLIHTGGAEPWQAQLGAPERGPARAHYSGRFTEPCRDKTQESRGGS